MYRLSSTNRWFNGMRFPGLVEAVQRAIKANEIGGTTDVLRDEDRHRVFVAWTPDHAVNRGKSIVVRP